ncbi:MAG: Lsr2 family protein [Nocardioides sp.]|nr:Lsr2 family protein [Nocardioides sp.]
MAQKVSIILVDDLDGAEADETVRFGLDGAGYEIDLTSAHAAELREALAPYVGHARKVSSGRRTRSSSSSSSGPSAADVRAWGRENGYDVPERGRIPAELREAYDAAN